MRNTKLILATCIIILTALSYSCKNDSDMKDSDSEEQYYGEKHRPQYHFTPEANWMNDPNGMVYYEGEYHLFYQYYPDSTVWGPMHWGHAVSEDMVHWEHLPIALYPDDIGCIFSGSAVVDWNNTSGLGKDGKPPMIAIFTYHNFDKENAKTNDHQSQGIAFSNDRGRTWEKFEGNPVIPNSEKIKDFRDPKVMWHESTKKWVMVLAAYDKVKFYASSNLIDWEFLSDYGIDGDDRLWECPDLIPMKVQGSDETKWVLIVSIQKGAPNGGTATSYFVGEFDGNEFKCDTKNQKWLDWGTDNYAFVTWSDVPKDDGRVLGIGWMSNWQYAQVVPTEKWRSAMTLPRELKLIDSKQGLRVTSHPVKELKSIRKSTRVFTSPDTIQFAMSDFEVDGGLYEIELDFKKPEHGRVSMQFENGLQNIVVYYDAETDEYGVDKSKSGNTTFHENFAFLHTAPRDYDSDNIKMHIFLDHSSLELFADDGRTVMTEIFFSDKPLYISMLNHSSFNKLGPEFSLVINDYKTHVLESVWD